MNTVLKKLLSLLVASGPVGWMGLITLAALALASFAIHELTTLIAAVLLRV